VRVLMTATSYPKDGQDWRGRFIADMAAHVGRRDGVELALWAPPGELPPAVRNAASEDGPWLQAMAEAGGIAHLLRRHPLRGIVTGIGLVQRQRRVIRAEQPQVVHSNWLQNALALGGSSLPTVVTVLGSDFGLLRLPGMVPALRAILRRRRAILAPNAAWMAPLLQSHFGDLAEVRPIPFGVAERWFAADRRPEAAASRRWLVVSRVTRAKLGHLLTWGEALFREGRELHLLGPMQEVLDLPPWIHYHGPTHPQALAEEWFPGACGLLTLSQHDEGRPQVMIEAMAAGLPVLATRLPAHADLIRHDVTGCLVDSPEALVQALTQMEDPQVNKRLGAAARSWIRDEIGTWDDCAARFHQAYQAVTQ